MLLLAAICITCAIATNDAEQEAVNKAMLNEANSICANYNAAGEKTCRDNKKIELIEQCRSWKERLSTEKISSAMPWVKTQTIARCYTAREFK